jgi:type I restriction enzyme S subunit
VIKRWLGYRRTPDDQLPKGWELKRLREISSGFKAGGSLGFTMSDFVNEGYDTYSAEGLTGKTSIAEFEGPAIIVSSIGSKCGKCFLANGKFSTLANVQVVFPNEAEIDSYFLWTLVNDEAFWPRAQTGQPFIRPSDIKKAWIPKPPRNEQVALRSVFESLDVAIASVLEKLDAARRVKTALMQQLFTRGVPSACDRPFRDTRIGTIPKDWELLQLGRVASIDSGIALNSHREPRLHPHQYLTVVHVQRERLDLSEVRYLEVFPHELPDALLKEGDIVLVEGHANASEIGRAALIDAKTAGLAYQNHLFRIRLLPDADLNRLFLLGLLNSERVRRHWVATCNTSSGLNTINSRGVRRLLIPRPSASEQENIAEMLLSANSKIAACENEVIACQRLKQSLLQNLLTRRVRVAA